jgi:hypothetical protein
MIATRLLILVSTSLIFRDLKLLGDYFNKCRLRLRELITKRYCGFPVGGTALIISENASRLSGLCGGSGKDYSYVGNFALDSKSTFSSDTLMSTTYVVHLYSN